MSLPDVYLEGDPLCPLSNINILILDLNAPRSGLYIFLKLWLNCKSQAGPSVAFNALFAPAAKLQSLLLQYGQIFPSWWSSLQNLSCGIRDDFPFCRTQVFKSMLVVNFAQIVGFVKVVKWISLSCCMDSLRGYHQSPNIDENKGRRKTTVFFTFSKKTETPPSPWGI